MSARPIETNAPVGRRVIAVFGEPVELPAVEGETRLSHHKKLADKFLERILALSAEEKSVRAGRLSR